MRLIALCAAALLLAGCVETTSTGGKVFGDSTSPRPKTIVIADFTVSSDLVVIDRGYTARLERKIGEYPTFERKQRTLERVNDEIIATMVATLKSVGLDAQPGSEESLALSERAVVVHGRLAPANASAQKNEAGIGGGKSGVIAELTLSSSGTFGKKQLLSFSTEPAGKKGASGKAATAMNASIAAALGAEKSAVKLSPDVESAARAIGLSAGDKIVAYAKEQGWLNKPDDDGAEEAKPEAKPADKDVPKTVKLPPDKPAKKPEA
jgi:hypothetical protein